MFTVPGMMNWSLNLREKGLLGGILPEVCGLIVHLFIHIIGTAAASQNRDGGLVLECESEGLSEAQLSKLRKIADDFNRLQTLLQNPVVQVTILLSYHL